MPKFLVTNGSNFQPFTYDELTRPLYEMAEAKRNTQDQYDALSMQTEALRNYISENEDDKRAKAMYDNYVSKLNALQDNLWSHGYTASTRRDLSAARTGFSSDIMRLDKAIKDRQTRSAEYNKFKHDHPDMVMGSDPGLDGLDNYLDNDMYGTDWYQYSGNQFTKEVAADAGNRIKEMFNDPVLSRDIPGYITIKKQQGVTSDDVAKANAAVSDYLAGRANAIGELDPVQTVLANVLLEHLESTGAATKVDPSEFARLVDYGKAGISAAIGTADTQYLKDPVFEANLEFNNWKRKQQYQGKNPNGGSGGTQTTGRGAFDYHVRNYTGENQEKANKQTMAYDMSGDSFKVMRDGSQMNNATASELVYSGDLRREAYRVLGFDIGRDEDANGLMPNVLGSGMLQGHIEHNGVEYDVRYNPRKNYNGVDGVIQTRKAGEGWKISPELTDYYKAKREQFENTRDAYKKDNKDIYDLATITPDKQYRDYNRQEEPFDTPLTEFRGNVMTKPENVSGEIGEPYIARRGTDSDYIERFSSYLASSFVLNADSKGNVSSGNDKSLKRYDGTSNYLHLIKSNGDLDNKTITDAGDVFTFDKDYNITNIRELRLSPQAIMDVDLSGPAPTGGYLIAELMDNREVALGLDIFDSMAISSILYEARGIMDRIIKDGTLTNRDKAAAMLVEANNASRLLRSTIGYYLQLGSPSGTSSKDNN